MATLKARAMRSLAAENNKDALIEAIRSKEIDPAIQKAAEKGEFYYCWVVKEKYMDYEEDVRKSLVKDGFYVTRDRRILREECYKISWV